MSSRYESDKQIYEMFKDLGSKSAVSRVMEIPKTTVWDSINRYERLYSEEVVPEYYNWEAETTPTTLEIEETTFEGEIGGEFTSDEELFKKFNLDPIQWEIYSITHNSWETPFKDENGVFTQATNKQSKVIFKKIIKDLTLDIIKEQYLIISKDYEPIVRKSNPSPCMYEIAIADHHFAKLAWDMETGESYDIKIAKRYYIDAIKDLLQKASHLNIEKILMPIGNDLFNFDGIKNETTAGTPQDSDSRWTKVFRVVSETMVEIIDICRTIADVNVVIVPGNHDRASCFYLGEFLSAWYRKDKNVDIDNGPTLRKYFRFGSTLIGMTHGSEEKHKDLPLLMAREAKDEWANVDFYEYQIGHWHRKKMTEYVAGDTYNGVQIRVLPSLTGTDAWHYSKGYVKGIKSAVGIVYEYDEGCIAEFITKVK